jgi:hypothetical protein
MTGSTKISCFGSTTISDPLSGTLMILPSQSFSSKEKSLFAYLTTMKLNGSMRPSGKVQNDT